MSRSRDGGCACGAVERSVGRALLVAQSSCQSAQTPSPPGRLSQAPVQSFAFMQNVEHAVPPPIATQTPSATPGAPQSSSMAQALVWELSPGHEVRRKTQSAVVEAESSVVPLVAPTKGRWLAQDPSTGVGTQKLPIDDSANANDTHRALGEHSASETQSSHKRANPAGRFVHIWAKLSQTLAPHASRCKPVH